MNLTPDAWRVVIRKTDGTRAADPKPYRSRKEADSELARLLKWCAEADAETFPFAAEVSGGAVVMSAASVSGSRWCSSDGTDWYASPEAALAAAEKLDVALTAVRLNQVVRFRENETTAAAGHITRVWDRPARDPYVTISSEGRIFVRRLSAVTLIAVDAL